MTASAMALDHCVCVSFNPLSNGYVAQADVKPRVYVLRPSKVVPILMDRQLVNAKEVS